MELLQILLSLFSNNLGGGAFNNVINLLKANSFDLKKTLSSLTTKDLEPILKEFLSAQAKKNPTDGYYSPSVGLSPIMPFADKQIVYILNKHFCSP